MYPDCSPRSPLCNVDPFGQRRCDADFHTGTRSRCKKQHTLCQHSTPPAIQALSVGGGKRVPVPVEETHVQFSYWVSGSQLRMVVAPMAGICEEE